MKDPAKKYFDRSVTDRERAVFEGGIALATIYHKFTGLPVTPDKELLSSLEKAIEQSASKQPFKEEVHARIREDLMKKGRGSYGYDELQGKMLDVSVMVRYGTARATLRVRYVEDIDYPLMYVESVDDGAPRRRGGPQL
ncbi:MAG: dihydroneopterin aldolase family protein [Nitrososphaerota archaeon]|nr:dihydroneopterin aldolase family protein [Nitrososphaerota archaeon]MDG6939891.1 dihydroneopterin aldolase family protein [Nitrososphaerota archaeon]